MLGMDMNGWIDPSEAETEDREQWEYAHRPVSARQTLKAHEQRIVDAHTLQQHRSRG